MLAPYATNEQNSRGRQYQIGPSSDRNEFQRDYTRIIHSRAFRRLQGKTQVFSSNLKDLPRTRMTHSLEVEQLSRAAARKLGINEDLCAVLAVAHDIGHPPFGHMGQDLLDELMSRHGGFEHNLQALRIVDEIESPYFNHEGLNLMFETREGLLKHCTRERAQHLGPVAARHLDGTSPPLETQLVDWCDAIAYLHADLEDAFSEGLLSTDTLKQAPGFMDAYERIKDRFPSDILSEDLAPNTSDTNARHRRRSRAMVREVVGEMLRQSTADLVHATRQRLDEADPKSLDDVRRLPPLVGFSPEHRAQHFALKKFSRTHIYEHPEIISTRADERAKLIALFNAYESDPGEMSGRGVEAGKDFHRGLCDHIAGMTDRFVSLEYERLLAERPDLMKSPSRRLAP